MRIFTVIILLVSVNAHGRTLSEEIDSFHRSAKLFQSEPLVRPRSSQLSPGAALEVLRDTWITNRAFRNVAAHFEGPNGLNQSDDRDEILFRLARHAFLLGDRDESLKWSSKALAANPASYWKASHHYLKGAIFYEAEQRTKAAEEFSRASSLGLHHSPGIYGRMALARLAFDAGRYEEAQRLYANVPAGTKAYESTLHESAHALSRLNRLGLASTNVSLLFALYPDSELLASAGFVLGRVHEKSDGLQAGLASMESVFRRFVFEEDLAHKALVSFQGREEALLFELEPRLGSREVFAILPPIARALFQKHPVVRAYISELSELRQSERELRKEVHLIHELRNHLNDDQSLTVETTALLEWANSIEKKISGIDAPSAQEHARLRVLATNLAELRKSLSESLRNLVEVDRHISMRFRIIAGQRETEALEIKSKVRKEMDETENLLLEVENAENSVRLRRLALRGKRVSETEAAFRALRSTDQKEEYDRLDQIRSDVIKHDKTARGQLLRDLETTAANVALQLNRVKSVRTLLLERSRIDIRRVIGANRTRLSSSLKKYRWALSDLKYRLLRAREDEYQEQLKQNDQEYSALLTRFSAVSPRPTTLIAPSAHVTENKTLELRMDDLLHFRNAAQNYQNELNSMIEQTMESDRKRFESYFGQRDRVWRNRLEESREEVLLSYQDFLRNTDETRETPFALYRFALLHYERAQKLQAESTDDQRNAFVRNSFELAIAPLKKIRDKYSQFRHRDAALYLLGYANLEIGDENESVQTFQRLVSEYPRSSLAPEVHLRIGEFYFSKRRFPEAIANYQRVLQSGFNYFYDKALYKLAWSYYVTKNYDSAVAYFLILLDYAAELPSGQRAKFVEFSDEATEYVALSFVQSGGAHVAERVFGKTGWKPYAFEILKKMSDLFVARGPRAGAFAVHDLLTRHYPSHPQLPAILRTKVALLEEETQDARLMTEKQRIRDMFAPNANWRTRNADHPDALREAALLYDEVSYSLATQYEARAQSGGFPEDLKKASAIYEEIAKSELGLPASYESRFRLGEVAYSQGKMLEAITYYDSVIRDGKYSKHFGESSYATVMSREKLLESASENDREEAIQKFVYAVDNFSGRVPTDSRVPDALYRAANVLKTSGRYVEAKDRYLAIYERYPTSKWKNSALVAAVDSLIAAQSWKEASLLAKQAAEKKNLPEEVKLQLLSLQEGALFKEAEEYYASGHNDEAVASFFSFQETFPKSPLAPKASLNALTISQKMERLDFAERAANILIETYPESPESAVAHFERALILDTQYAVGQALDEYAWVLQTSKDRAQLKDASFRSMELLASNQKTSLARMKELWKYIEAPMTGVARLLTAQAALQWKQSAAAQEILASVANDTSTSAEQRAIAAARSAQIDWKAGRDTRARKSQEFARSLLKSVPDSLRGRAEHEVAVAMSLGVSHDAAYVSKLGLQAQDERRFSSSFQRRAEALGRLETSALAVLKLRSITADARALFELGQAYGDFVILLRDLEPPAAIKTEFVSILSRLLEPLEIKRNNALDSAKKLVMENRLLEPFSKQLFPPEDTSASPNVLWVSPMLASPPTFLTLPESSGPKVASTEPVPGSVTATDPKADSDIKASDSALLYNERYRKELLQAFGLVLMKDFSSAEARYNLAVVQLANGDFRQAEATDRIIQTMVPELKTAELKAYRAYLSEDFETASQLYGTIVEQRPESARDARNLALSLIRKGDPEKALAVARDFLLRHPKSDAAHALMAIVFEAKGDVPLARLAWKRVLELQPASVEARISSARLFDAGSDSLERSQLMKVDASEPSPEANANWAALGFLSGQYATACKEWEEASKDAANRHPQILHNLKNCGSVK